jgi:glycosyltransferase involved in cell wall biosynthesis
MKKILFVSNTAWSLYNFRLGLMNALESQGFTISFCSSYDEYADRLKEKEFQYIKIDLDRKGLNPFKELTTIFSFYKIYKKEKPDLILHFTIKPNIYGGIAAKLNGIDFIDVITGLGFAFTHKGLLTKIVEFLYRISLRFSRKVIFLNEDDLNSFVNKKIVQKEKVKLILSEGVNIDYFSPIFCSRVKKERNKFVFLYLGRILKDKGVEVLVSAYKKVKQVYPKTELWFLGPIDAGNPSTISQNEIKDWEKDNLIKYLGTVLDVRSFICKADCVVLPSYYKEGVPRSLLEAASMEKPIITTDAVGCREVVDNDKNGFLVPIKDFKGLTKAMIKMLEIGSNKCQEMGKLGREKVMREFNEKDVIRKYLEAIR